MTNLIAFIFLVVMVTLATYFFNDGKMEGGLYIGFILGVIVMFLAFYGFDRLKELDVKNLKLVLSEMKETKRDFDTEVDLLLNTMAKDNIDSAITVGRWNDGDEIQYKMIEKRNNAMDLLRKAGHDENYITKKTDIINSYILGDIVYSLVRESFDEINNREITKKEKSEIINSLQKIPQEVRTSTIPDDQLLETLKERLSTYGIFFDKNSEYYKDITFFIAEKHLRRPVAH